MTSGDVRAALTSPRAFRGLIVANGILIGTAIAVWLATEHRLPAELRAYLDAEADAPLDDEAVNDLILGSVVSLLYLAVMVGLFFFKRWARTLLPFTLVAGAAVTALYGPTVEHASVTAIGYLTNIVDGMLLAVVYFSSIGERFRLPGTGANGLASLD